MVAKFQREGEPVTRVDFEFFGLIKMLSNGSAVRPSGLPIRKRYGGTSAKHLPILFLPPPRHQWRWSQVKSGGDKY